MKSYRTGYSLIMLLLGSSSKAKTFWIFQMSKGKQKSIKKKKKTVKMLHTSQVNVKKEKKKVCPYMHECDINFYFIVQKSRCC